MPETAGRNFVRNVGVMLTAEPVFGRALSLPECAEALSRMSLGSVLARLSLLKYVNEEILLDPDATPEERRHHTRLVLGTLLDRAHRERAEADVRAEENFLPLSNQALLAAMQLAMECSPRDTEHWVTGDPWRLLLTHVLLSFQSAGFSAEFRASAAQQRSFEGMGPRGQAEFIRNHFAHVAPLYTRPVIGRLFGMFHTPEIEAYFQQKTGESVATWTTRVFGLTPDEYLAAAFLSGGAKSRFNRDNPDADKLLYSEESLLGILREPLREKIERLYRLASRPVGEPSGTTAGTIDDYTYAATAFLEQPVVNFGTASLCVSPDLMVRKFLFGVPYLAQQAMQRAAGRPLNDSEITSSRAPFGHLFEGYVQWLIRALLKDVNGIEIIANVSYDRPAEQKECDIVIRRGDMAIALEAKSTLSTLRFRQTGDFAELDRLLLGGAKQAYRAARAIRGGRARKPDGVPIEGVRCVIPCVVTLESIPLFEPIAEFYERHLAAEAELPLFVPEDGVEAVQFFDIEFVESLETDLDLSPGSAAVFGYLLQRARRESLRYRSIRTGISPPASPGAPRPFNDLVERSRVAIDAFVRSWINRDSGPSESPGGSPRSNA